MPARNARYLAKSRDLHGNAKSRDLHGNAKSRDLHVMCAFFNESEQGLAGRWHTQNFDSKIPYFVPLIRGS
jgi:hypothetical protein